MASGSFKRGLLKSTSFVILKQLSGANGYLWFKHVFSVAENFDQLLCLLTCRTFVNVRLLVQHPINSGENHVQYSISLCSQ